MWYWWLNRNKHTFFVPKHDTLLRRHCTGTAVHIICGDQRCECHDRKPIPRQLKADRKWLSKQVSGEARWSERTTGRYSNNPVCECRAGLVRAIGAPRESHLLMAEQCDAPLKGDFRVATVKTHTVRSCSPPKAHVRKCGDEDSPRRDSHSPQAIS